MKINKIFAAALAATVLLASCSKENAESVITSSNGEKTMARIVLSQSGTGNSRATGDKVDPTATEKAVKSATVYVFNSTRVLETTVAMDLSGETASKLIEVTTGLHYFYATINMAVKTPEVNAASPVFTVPANCTTVEFEKLLSSALADMNAPTNATTGFWMTNTEGAKQVSLVEATETEAATAGHNNNFVINVGRAIGKVQVHFDPATATQMGGKLTNVLYRVINNPVKLHLMPVIEGGFYKSPYYAEAAVNAANYFNNKPYRKTAATGDTGFSYMMENSNNVPKEGNASTLLIRGKFTPDASLLRKPDGTAAVAADLPAAGTFWRIANLDNGKIVSYGDYYYTAEPNVGQLIAGQGTVRYTNGICYYWLPLKDATGTDVQARYTVKRNQYYYVDITSVNGAGYTDGPGDGTIDNSATPSDPGNGTDPQLPGGGNEGNDDDSGFGGGQPDEEGPVNPENPLETTTNLKATISILQWVKVEQTGGI